MNRSVIAEIGINHDGKIDKAKRLIELSSKAGCKGIKFQYRNLLTAYSAEANEIGDEIILTQIQKTYLNAEQILDLRDFARSLGLDAGISFFTSEDIKDFPDLKNDFDFFKIPSAELSNIDLIERLLETNKHVYISTGMHAEHEIQEVFSKIAKKLNWSPMHCISNYPVAAHNASLGYIKYLQMKWNRPVGYSSHDENWENSIVALSLGADVIERHITESKDDEGLDHSSSSNFEEIKRICDYVKNIEILLSGDSARIPNQGELLNRQNLGRSYYSTRMISAGETLDLSDFIYRSPQTGLSKAELAAYSGRVFTTEVPKGAVLTAQHFQKNRVHLKEKAINTANKIGISIPVRLADYQEIKSQIPVGAYEFHLSYKEVASDLETFVIDGHDKFSVHLPDYINSTTLIDPFSPNRVIQESSINCIKRVCDFAQRLAEETQNSVPIVASLAGIGLSREEFYPKVKSLFGSFSTDAAILSLQWLPPYAWYFGGSIELGIVNQVEDVAWINRFELPITLDTSHLLLGQAASKLIPNQIVEGIEDKIIHWHISDASGIDGEGLPIGAGGPENEKFISEVLLKPHLKVLEVWQGHFNEFEGFKVAVNKVHQILGNVYD
ncbi:SpsE Sialic acid synthase [Candidatus Nanopelagicaceae bacterium]